MPVSAVALVASNAIPLLGVLLFGWDLFVIVALYWLETAVIILLNVPKMAMARGPTRPEALDADDMSGLPRLILIPFFLVHSGIFMLGHGVFLVVAFSIGSDEEPSLAPLRGNVLDLAIGLIALGASHGVSFVTNFLGRQEFAQVSIREQMMKPYSRIIVMHLFIFVAMGAALLLGSAGPAVVLLVVVKTAADLWAHLREHRASAPH